MDALGTASYERNELGRLTEITDLNGSTWTFSHTAMGLLESATDPLGNAWHEIYDGQGQLSERRYPGGETQTVTYDEQGRPVGRAFSSGLDLTYGYDVQGRLVSTDGLELILDEDGRPISTVSGGVAFDANYDAGGRLLSVDYADGLFAVTYTYDAADRLRGITDSLTGTRATLLYDADGRLTSIERSNGVRTDYAWDDASRLISIREGALTERTYTYNEASEVTREVRTGLFGDEEITYEYDGAGRLVSVAYGADDRITYTYDAAGNLLGREGRMPNGLQCADGFTYDAAHRVISPGYAYDPRGRVAASPSAGYAWDGASRLTEVGGAALSYSGLGNLLTRSMQGTETRFHYNHALTMTPIVAEGNETTGEFSRFYVWTPGGGLLYMIDAASGEVRHFHFDLSGSTIALTDSGGNVTDTYDYSPYGIALRHDGDSRQPFTFIGGFGVRTESAVSGLYDMSARYYDAVTARFLSRETVWPVVADPRQLNPYQYAHQNPITFGDPHGLWPRFLRFRRIKHGGKGLDDYHQQLQGTGFWEGFLERGGRGILESIPGWNALEGMYVGEQPPIGHAANLGGEISKDVFGAPFALMEFGLESLRDLSWWYVSGREAPPKHASWWKRTLYRGSKWITESEIIYPVLIELCQKVEEGFKKLGEHAVDQGGKAIEGLGNVGREWGSDIGTRLYGSKKENVELTQEIYRSKNPFNVVGWEVGEAAHAGYSSYSSWAKEKTSDFLHWAF